MFSIGVFKIIFILEDRSVFLSKDYLEIEEIAFFAAMKVILYYMQSKYFSLH